MNIRQIEYFVEIANTGSLSRAASRLRIVQSALSRQMKLLEDDLGVAVLERHGRGMRLTEAGRLLHEGARRVLREVSHLREEVVALSRVPTGSLHIAIPTSARALLTRPAVEPFLQTYPEVFVKALEDTSAVVKNYLLAGEVDIALIAASETTPQMESTPLLTENMYLVGAIGSKLSLDRPCSLAEVAEHVLMLPSHPSILRVGLDRVMAEANLEARYAADINSTMLFDLVRAGHAFTVFSYCGIHTLLEAGDITAAPIEGFQMSWAIVTSRERPLSLATRLFRDMLVETAQAAVAEGRWISAKLAGASI
jgi:LysR family transcriptional regulator, nitrogen assimilation regulatory protein